MRTHGMRSALARMHTGRLDRRTKRAMAKMWAALEADTLEGVHASTRATFCGLNHLAQGYLTHAIATGTELPKSALGVLNNWRRTAELLTQLEEQLAARDRDRRGGAACARCGQHHADLASYLKCSRSPAAPAATGTTDPTALAAVVPVPPSTPAPAEPGDQTEEGQ